MRPKNQRAVYFFFFRILCFYERAQRALTSLLWGARPNVSGLRRKGFWKGVEACVKERKTETKRDHTLFLMFTVG